uniref:GDPGP1-like N-terminal domain-containing protein n=1 Tax=Salix viminalis TaxID=40686 RepID=A0A6N2MW79_SALVM
MSNFVRHCTLQFLSPLFFVLVLLLGASYQSASVDLNREDKASLLLFRSWIQDPAHGLSSWFGSNCTTWAGLVCQNHTGQVISINLRNLNLSGHIHPNLCNLLFLETLVLSENGFTGQIPLCFGRLQNLKTLDLSHNRFGGVVPDSLMRLGQLKELILNGNHDLGGVVPWWVGNFSTNMERLDLGFNSFHGTIPESLFNSKSLKYLDLGNNNLSGDLHDFFQPLVFLNLSSNSLSGTLPCFSASIRSLIVLNLAMNSIVGGIPTCIASLEELTHLNLSSNHLNFAISPRLVFSEKLLALDLSFNDLSGPLPTKIAETTEKSGLVLLDLSHNCFSGGIPLKITELKSLQALFLSHNLLTGEIPARIGNLTYLQVIDLSRNSLSGSIPLNIVGCFQLLALVLNNNNLSGQIQPELDALDSLKVLDISNNGISGEIPLTLAGCKSLEIVDFSSNNLSGNLNDAITKWSNLRYLSLARNKFSGSLPSWLFTFEEIQMMDFSGNKFSGLLPNGNFNISSEFNNGDVRRLPAEPFLAIRNNIEIKISVLVVDNSELSFNYHLSSNAGIDLSDNLLHGEIPRGLFGLQGLEYLNLSYNSLDGQVPSLEKMQRLRALDLSHNSLSGQTPGNISRLKELVLLNFSYNSLSGFVPWKEGYGRFPGAFVGNPDLCVESRRVKCDSGSLPTVPGKSFEETEGFQQDRNQNYSHQELLFQYQKNKNKIGNARISSPHGGRGALPSDGGCPSDLLFLAGVPAAWFQIIRRILNKGLKGVAGIALGSVVYQEDNSNLIGNSVEKSSEEQPQICFLHNLLPGQWEDRMSRCLFRHDDFDENEFNFTEVGQEEVLFRFEKSNDHKRHFPPPVTADSNSSSVVAMNVSPIEYGHVLLIPQVLNCLPQKIDHGCRSSRSFL